MNLKDKILGVAKELFIKNGYNATTTGEIVKLSESSKGNLYYHFKTKENLFLEILNIEWPPCRPSPLYPSPPL